MGHRWRSRRGQVGVVRGARRWSVAWRKWKRSWPRAMRAWRSWRLGSPSSRGSSSNAPATPSGRPRRSPRAPEASAAEARTQARRGLRRPGLSRHSHRDAGRSDPSPFPGPLSFVRRTRAEDARRSAVPERDSPPGHPVALRPALRSLHVLWPACGLAVRHLPAERPRGTGPPLPPSTPPAPQAAPSRVTSPRRRGQQIRSFFGMRFWRSVLLAYRGMHREPANV